MLRHGVAPVTRTPEATGVPKVLEKALRVLDLFSERSPAWTVTGIARELRVPLTTTHRIVRGLEAAHYLRRLPGGEYRLGLEAISLGRRAAGSFDLRGSLRSSLEWLSLETNETTAIATFDEGRCAALYVDTIERTHPVRISVEIGVLAPLATSAHGRALLAFLGDDVVARATREFSEQGNGRSSRDPDELRRNLALTRERGFALVVDEAHPGVWEMAAPILDAHRTPLASIGFLSPAFRLDAELERRGGEYVVQAARDAEAELGAGRGDPNDG